MGWRSALTQVGILTALSVLIGVVGALVWANVAVLPAYQVQGDGHAVITEQGMSQVFSATFTYVLVGLVGGVAIGVATWARLRRLGWPVALINAGLALAAGGTCWMLGELLGPGPFPERIAAAQPGETVQIALELTSPSALAIWVFASAAVPLFAAALGPEVDDEEASSAEAPETSHA